MDIQQISLLYKSTHTFYFDCKIQSECILILRTSEVIMYKNEINLLVSNHQQWTKQLFVSNQINQLPRSDVQSTGIISVVDLLRKIPGDLDIWPDEPWSSDKGVVECCPGGRGQTNKLAGSRKLAFRILLGRWNRVELGDSGILSGNLHVLTANRANYPVCKRSL